MKKPASPNKTEKRAKRTPEEKSARKSAKKTSRATADLSDDRADKKASQKKSLKSAAKQLQKELNGRMNEVVARIRKETKAKLKEVVKEATRRLDGDTERMFEQALHTIVRHYDSVSGSATSAAAAIGDNAGSSSVKPTGGGKKGKTLNKDGTPRKIRASSTETTGAPETNAAPKASGRKISTAGTKPAAIGVRRGPKPAAATASTTAASRRSPKPGTPVTGAKRGPKPRVQATPAPVANDVMNSADSANNGEVSA